MTKTPTKGKGVPLQFGGSAGSIVRDPQRIKVTISPSGQNYTKIGHHRGCATNGQ